MTETGASFNRPYKPFGMNVKVPEIGDRTLKLAGGTVENLIKAPIEPLFNFLEENEEVFNGSGPMAGEPAGDSALNADPETEESSGFSIFGILKTILLIAAILAAAGAAMVALTACRPVEAKRSIQTKSIASLFIQ